MENTKVGGIITKKEKTALLILTVTELFKEQHDGFWTSELHRPGFESYCDLGQVIYVSFLLRKRGIEIVISRVVLIIKYDSIYALLGIRLDDNHYHSLPYVYIYEDLNCG